MKSDKGKKAATGILIFVAFTLILYVVQSLYFDKSGIAETEYVLNYIQKDVIEVDGFAVRDEYREENGLNKLILYKNSNKVYVPIISDSEGVAVKDTIAVAFESTAQADAYLKINELTDRKNELSALKDLEEMSKISLTYLNSQIYKTVQAYVACLSEGDYKLINSSIDSFCADITSKQIATGYNYDFSELIADCDKEISLLEASVGEKEYIMSPCAGYFVSTVDGFEQTVPFNDIKEGSIKPQMVFDLYSTVPNTEKNAYGKIITQHVWYLLTDIPIEKAAEIKEGKTVYVSFPERDIDEIPMSVYDISDVKNGIITVTFKCKYLNEELATLRKEKVAITVSEYSGFKISNSALVKNSEGLDGVYVLSGNIAQFTPVNIVYYGTDFVIAHNYVAYLTDEDGNLVLDEEKNSSYRKLKAYDSIIVKGTNIEDGKVID